MIGKERESRKEGKSEKKNQKREEIREKKTKRIQILCLRIKIKVCCCKFPSVPSANPSPVMFLWDCTRMAICERLCSSMAVPCALVTHWSLTELQPPRQKPRQASPGYQ